MSGYGLRRRSGGAVLLIIAVAGTLVFLVYGFFHRDDAHPTPAPPADAPTVPSCPPAPRTDEGAARIAWDALHQLALANLGQADIDKTVDTYVAPDTREGVHAYLDRPKPPVSAVDSTLLGWQAVAYTPDQVTLRFATSDVTTTDKGEKLPPAQYVGDLVLVWSPTGTWQLAGYGFTPVTNALAQLVNPRSFCA